MQELHKRLSSDWNELFLENLLENPVAFSLQVVVFRFKVAMEEDPELPSSHVHSNFPTTYGIVFSEKNLRPGRGATAHPETRKKAHPSRYEKLRHNLSKKSTHAAQ